MSQTMNVHGIEKEVKWVEVTPDKGVLKVFFTDMTYVMVEGVKVNVIEEEEEG